MRWENNRLKSGYKKILLWIIFFTCLNVSMGVGEKNPFKELDNFHKEKKYTEGINLAKELIKKYPDKTKYRLKLIELYIETNQIREAISLLNVLILTDPQNVDVKTWLGIAYINWARVTPLPWNKWRYYEKSVSQLTEALTLFPDHFLANCVLGRIYTESPIFMGKLAAGIEYLKKSIKIGESLGMPSWQEKKLLCESYYYLGQAYEKARNFLQAKRCYEKVINNYLQLYPEFPFIDTVHKRLKKMKM